MGRIDPRVEHGQHDRRRSGADGPAVYRVDVGVAMDWRSDGRDLRDLASDAYRDRHASDGTPPGHARSKDKHKDHPGKGHKNK